LEQGDGELARQAGQLLERLRVDRAVLGQVREQLAAQVEQGGRTEPEIFADLRRASGVRERFQQRLRARQILIDQRRQLIDARRLQARLIEQRSQPLL